MRKKTNDVISAHLSENIGKQFNDFLNELDKLNDCKDYNELKSRANRLKSYINGVSEQIDALVFAYSPKFKDYMYDNSKYLEK